MIFILTLVHTVLGVIAFKSMLLLTIKDSIVGVSRKKIVINCMKKDIEVII